MVQLVRVAFFFFNDTATTEIYTLSLHDALPICKVLGYQSQIIFEPEVVVELFFFDRAVDDSEREATARGQLEEPSVGEAREDAHTEDVTGDIEADRGND